MFAIGIEGWLAILLIGLVFLATVVGVILLSIWTFKRGRARIQAMIEAEDEISRVQSKIAATRAMINEARTKNEDTAALEAEYKLQREKLVEATMRANKLLWKW